ncbi:unnamed protein product [Cyclocybe aegerita]|uniref:Uncharacterized protein n=1 Tax=Cyclocybe aegerita TaxID=1973307 RepID=A0A8S0X9J0_CYCAE|nr:unnamed protein product [Cyclocybe aegerita]
MAPPPPPPPTLQPQMKVPIPIGGSYGGEIMDRSWYKPRGHTSSSVSFAVPHSSSYAPQQRHYTMPHVPPSQTSSRKRRPSSPSRYPSSKVEGVYQNPLREKRRSETRPLTCKDPSNREEYRRRGRERESVQVPKVYSRDYAYNNRPGYASGAGQEHNVGSGYANANASHSTSGYQYAPDLYPSEDKERYRRLRRRTAPSAGLPSSFRPSAVPSTTIQPSHNANHNVASYNAYTHPKTDVNTAPLSRKRRTSNKPRPDLSIQVPVLPYSTQPSSSVKPAHYQSPPSAQPYSSQYQSQGRGYERYERRDGKGHRRGASYDHHHRAPAPTPTNAGPDPRSWYRPAPTIQALQAQARQTLGPSTSVNMSTPSTSKHARPRRSSVPFPVPPSPHKASKIPSRTPKASFGAAQPSYGVQRADLRDRYKNDWKENNVPRPRSISMSNDYAYGRSPGKTRGRTRTISGLYTLLRRKLFRC